MTFYNQRAECLLHECKVTNHFSSTCSRLCIQVASRLFGQCLWHVPLLNNRYLVYVTFVKFFNLKTPFFVIFYLTLQ